MNRDTRFLLELGALLAVLIAGAVLRYWLSTVVPFDADELSALLEATNPSAGIRVPMIMLNGASLFLLFLLLRRSAGVEVAFFVLLLLQASLTFQYSAMRIRLWPAAALLIMAVATYARYTHPPKRAPRKLARALGVLALALGLRELYLVVTLPGRLDAIRTASAADPEPLRASLRAAGAGAVTPLERFRQLELDWPKQRSLRQQDLLVQHRLRLGPRAIAIYQAEGLPTPEQPYTVVYDPEAVAFIAVPNGLELDVALRVLRSAKAR